MELCAGNRQRADIAIRPRRARRDVGGTLAGPNQAEAWLKLGGSKLGGHERYPCGFAAKTVRSHRAAVGNGRLPPGRPFGGRSGPASTGETDFG